MNKVFGAVLIAFLAASCQSSDSTQTTDTETTATAPANPATTPMSATAQQPAISSTPADQGITVAPNAPAVSAAPANGTGAAAAAGAGKAGINPEHGKPGHRCDIPVGASLNTPVQSAPAPTQAGNNAGPVMTQVPAPAAVQPANKNARLNPAHGQPGHDCAVPVGQPLKG